MKKNNKINLLSNFQFYFLIFVISYGFQCSTALSETGLWIISLYAIACMMYHQKYFTI